MLKRLSSFRPARLARMLAWALWVPLAVTGISMQEAQAADKAALVKSAYIFNFTKFVIWPQMPDQITVCAFGPNGLGDALKDIEKESTPQYPVVVQPNIAPLALTGCQMVYMDSHSNAQEAELFAAVRDLPILTVGEGGEFVGKGGMVAFVNDGAHIKLEINLKAADQAGLKLDPQLLEIARRVVK